MSPNTMLRRGKAAMPSDTLSAVAREFYVDVLSRLVRSGIPFLLGGAYAIREYAGVERHTKDLDLFCVVEDYPGLLQVLAEAGYRTELTFAGWLAKASHGEECVDIIFSSPNAICPVEPSWFDHAPEMEVFGLNIRLVPPEEMVWCKAYVQERERFDGADVLHILRKQGDSLDWRRLLDLFGEGWEILMSHLLTFRFVYPSERNTVPEWVMRELLGRLERQLSEPSPSEPVCRGLLISDRQYQIDVTEWGYRDARARLIRGGLKNT